MDRFKIFQVNPSQIVNLELLYLTPERAAKSYTVDSQPVEAVPSSVDKNTQTVVTSIIVTNVTANTPAFSIVLFPTVAEASVIISGVDDKHFLFKQLPMTARQVQVLSLGLVLPAGSSLYVASSVIDEVSFTAMLSEVT